MKKKYTKREVKLFYLTRVIKEVSKELAQLVPYIEKKIHRERIEALVWKLNFSLRDKGEEKE